MKIIKKKIIINLIIILSLFGFNTLSNSMENKNFYQFNIIDIDGEKIDLHKFEGKTILLVNYIVLSHISESN